MKKLVSILLLVVLANTLIVGTAFAVAVMDVTTSTNLNIRSGPGLSYSIIAQVNPGSDILFYYEVDAGVSADGYNWRKVYYPSAAIGQYSSSAVGWAAWYPYGTGHPWYYYYTTGVTVISSTGIYEYQYPNLTSPYPMLYNYGQDIGGWDQDGGLAGLKYESGYPNAWRLYRLDGSYDLGYGNGWKLNAKDFR